MPILVTWDNLQKRTVRMQFMYKWTVADYYTAIQKVVEMMKSVQHTVHILADLSHTTTVPMDILVAASNAFNKFPENRGFVFVLHSNAFIRIMANTFLTVNPHLRQHIYFINHRNEIFDTLDEVKATEVAS